MLRMPPMVAPRSFLNACASSQSAIQRDPAHAGWRVGDGAARPARYNKKDDRTDRTDRRFDQSDQSDQSDRLSGYRGPIGRIGPIGPIVDLISRIVFLVIADGEYGRLPRRCLAASASD